jgi:pre-mRNA-splicing factor CWC22
MALLMVAVGCHCCCAVQVGAHLQDVAPAGLHSVFERFRAILHEGAIDKRCQYMIEGLFAVRKVRVPAC